jgi:hypothetical protein
MAKLAGGALIALMAVILFSPCAFSVGLTDADIAPFENRLNDKYSLTDEQLSRLEAMITTHPDEAYLRYLLARHQRRLGYTQLSDETMQEAQKTKDASGFFRKIIEQEVANCNVLRAVKVMQFAQNWHAQSEIGKALTAFVFNEQALMAKSEEDRELLISRCNQNIKELMPGRSTWPAGVGGLLGQVRYVQGKCADALLLADADLKNNPRSLLANEVKGLSSIALGNMRAAVEPLSIVFDKYPNNGRTTPSYAQALIATGQTRKALRPALYSLTQASDYAQLKVFEQRLAGILPRISPAVLDATIGDVIKSAGWTTQRYTFYFALAESFQVAHRDREALRYYAIASAVNNAPTTALNRIATIHQQAGRYDEARLAYMLSWTADRGNTMSALAFNRLTQRLDNRQNDVAWQFKDWLRRLAETLRRASPSAKRS